MPAAGDCEKDTIVSYGDALFKKYIAEMLSESDGAFTIAVDTARQESVNRQHHADYAECSLPYSREVFGQEVHLARMVHGRAGDGAVHGRSPSRCPLTEYSCCTYSTRMRKKLTITVDEKVYAGLHRVVGRRKISSFIESVVGPHVLQRDLAADYREMAADEARETEAKDWAEATVMDVADEAR